MHTHLGKNTGWTIFHGQIKSKREELPKKSEFMLIYFMFTFGDQINFVVKSNTCIYFWDLITGTPAR